MEKNRWPLLGYPPLYTQIKLICDKKFDFDKDVHKLYQSEILHIFPILVHSDFNYTMPGTNRYLHEKFADLLSGFCPDNLRIAPLVMINLETITDLSITGKGINDLGMAIEKFIDFVNENERAFFQTASQTYLLRSSSSFDSFYHQNIAVTSENVSIADKIQELMSLAKISVEELNVPIG